MLTGDAQTCLFVSTEVIENNDTALTAVNAKYTVTDSSCWRKDWKQEEILSAVHWLLSFVYSL